MTSTHLERETAQESILTVDSVSLEFDTGETTVEALRDVSLEIKEGETLGIAGESGSGKSTLAKALIRRIDENGTLTQGDIYFEGKSIREMSRKEIRRLRGNDLAYVAQNPEKALNPSIRIGKQIREAVELNQDLDGDTAKERVRDVLRQVNIPDPEYYADRYPHELSGGMQQRALIAIALSCNPKLLILDEPTTGLDVTTQAKILDLIQELKADLDISIVLISHNLDVIGQIADKVSILYAGEVMESGTADEVFETPANPYTQGLLAALPRLNEEYELVPIPGQIPDLTSIPDGCIFADRCEFATQECTETDVSLESLPDSPGHQTRCLHWDEALDNPIQPQEKSTTITTSGETILETKGLQKHFGDHNFLDRWLGSSPPVKAVDGVDLAIGESETVGLVGESGCGKSTFGKVLLGLLNPTGGTVSYRGEEISSLDDATYTEFRSECQIVFQHPDSSLNPQKTVYEIIDRQLQKFTEKDKPERNDRIEELLDQVNLSRSLATNYPHELSGGEQQRVAIARAFAANPSFVLLDEPVSSLDVSVQASILNLLNELRDEYNTSYLLISHDLSVVNAICDRIGVMYLGKIVEQGTKADVFEPPFHPYTRALLSSSPALFSDSTQRIHLDGDVPSPRDPPDGCSFHTRCPQKIGSVCETETPELDPVAQSETSHCIACHLDEKDMSVENSEI